MKSYTKLSIALVPMLGVFSTTQAAYSLSDDASIFVSASATSRSESNVLMTHENEISDTAFTFTPGVDLTLGRQGMTDLTANASYRLHVISYVDNDELNANDNEAVASMNFKSANLDIKGFVSYVEAQTNTQIWDSGILDYEPGTVDRSIFNASAYSEIEVGPKTRVGAGVAYMDQKYDPVEYTDYSSFSIPVDVYFSVSPKLDVTVDGSYRTVKVGESDKELKDTSLMVGLRGCITPKLSGFFRAGYVSRDAGDTGLAESSGLTLSSDLAYNINPLVTMSIGLLRDLSISPVSANTTERTGGSVRANFNLTDTVTLRGSAIYYTTDYDDYDRSDDYTVLGIGASYKPNKYLTISADYSGVINDSNIESVDYKDNVLQVAVSVRY